jgi:hypothetical protein
MLLILVLNSLDPPTPFCEFEKHLELKANDWLKAKNT